MIVLLARSGQLGNRLRSLSAFVALGIEYNQKVYCPLAGRDLEKYLNLRFETENGIYIKMCDNRALFGISKILNTCEKYFGFKTNTCLRTNTNSVGFRIMTDWISFADEELLYKHYDLIQQYFGFKQSFADECKKKIDEFKQSGKILVAVHFRRKDYKIWHGGKWYFTNEEFLAQMRALYNENNNISFLVFTNDELDKDLFSNEKFEVNLLSGTAMEDLCCMSLCDYIIGPPSTFSCWAGYIGNKRLLWMKEHGEIYHFDEFQNVPESMVKTKSFWELL